MDISPHRTDLIATFNEALQRMLDLFDAKGRAYIKRALTDLSNGDYQPASSTPSDFERVRRRIRQPRLRIGR